MRASIHPDPSIQGAEIAHDSPRDDLARNRVNDFLKKLKVRAHVFETRRVRPAHPDRQCDERGMICIGSHPISVVDGKPRVIAWRWSARAIHLSVLLSYRCPAARKICTLQFRSLALKGLGSCWDIGERD